MFLQRLTLASFSVAATFLIFDEPLAQSYPTRPIRIVCAEPGASNDFLARTIAESISKPLGQQVIVDNRASVLVPGIVMKANPDGYTLMVSSGILWISPLLQSAEPAAYDPVNDFAPITIIGSSPVVLAVHPGLTADSVSALVALAKAKPGQLNYGSGGSGSAGHLAAELFKAAAGVNIVRIPYKGAGPAVSAVIGGQVQLIFATPGSVLPHIKSGRLRGLAVTSAHPTPLAPGMPTVAESGVPGFESLSFNAAFAPAKTAAAIIAKLNGEIVQALKQPSIRERLHNAGTEVVANTPAQAAAIIKTDMARMSKVIKDAGIGKG